LRHGEVRRMRRARRFSGEGLTGSLPEGTAQAFLERRGFIDVLDVPGGQLYGCYFICLDDRRNFACEYGIVTGKLMNIIGEGGVVARPYFQIIRTYLW